MGKRVAQRAVALADLTACGAKPFERRPGESLRAMRTRLRAMPGLHDTRGGRKKVGLYERAMARGEAFPPVFVIALEGALLLDDGCHRTTAAAVRGARDTQAVVIDAATREEADTVSALLFELEGAGVSWQERAGLVTAMLGD